VKRLETRQAVGRFFDGYAEAFDAIGDPGRRRGAFGRWVDRTFREVMVHRFEETMRGLERSGAAVVLDVGCGSGRYVVAIAERGRTVVGIDLAPGMLSLARAAVERAKVGERVTLMEGDYVAADVGRRFDAACLMGFFDYVEDPAAVLRKLRRDVSGEVYASFPKAGGWLAWQRRARYRMRGCPLYLYRRRDVERALTDGGFSGGYEIRDFGRDWYVVAQDGAWLNRWTFRD
jgi:SAM-dependent methyltransferase